MDVGETREVFKVIDGVELEIRIFQSEAPLGDSPRPAIVFFFGGGWNGGTTEQFAPHCRHLAGLGMVAAAAEYRVRSRHGVTPFECVRDGKSAVRWLRAQADRLHIDPARVTAGGGSAGGHVAACTGVVEGFDEEGEDLTVSSRPDAMILFNPVLDTSPETGFGSDRFSGRGKALSPLHHVRPGLPPTLVFHGTEDTTVPFECAKGFEQAMQDAGNFCRLVRFEGKAHAFFNYGKHDNVPYRKTLEESERFLAEQGMMPVQG